MSRSRKYRYFMKAGLAVATVAGAFGAVSYCLWILSLDPFAKFRPTTDADDSREMSIEYKNVEFTLYDEKAQIATCDVDKVNVRRDRQVFEMVGITNGKMATSEGGFGFETGLATYERRTKVLSALKGGRVWNSDMNLKADGFAYYQNAKTLQTTGKVTGDFYGGTVVAYNLRYNPVEETASAGPIEWTGKLEKFGKDMPILQSSKAPWTIKGDMKMAGDESIWTKGRATDGDIIVLADTIVHNKKTDVVTASGNVKYYSAKANMTCKQAIIYRKEKRADLTGDVEMLVKPKDQEKLEETVIPPFRPVVPETIAAGRPTPPTAAEKEQDEEVRKNNFRKYPTQIQAEKIVYYYEKGKRRANISGTPQRQPQAQQDMPGGRWRHILCITAAFDVEADKLRLNSSDGKRDVRLRTSIGDDLTAKWLLVSTKEGVDEMEGEEVEGTVISDDDDLNNRNAKPPTTGGGTGGSTGGGLKGKIGA